MAKDHDKTPPRLPDLDRVEAEGRKAADAQAKRIVDATLANGGRLDEPTLARAGQDVRKRVITRLAATASQPKPVDPPAHSPPTQRVGAKARRRTGGNRPKPSAGRSARPRIAKHWRKLQRHPPRRLLRAVVLGSLASAFLLAAALAAHILLNT